MSTLFQQVRNSVSIGKLFNTDLQDIRKYQPNEIADELTLINQNFLQRIRPEELFDFAFLSSKKNILAPNITYMFEFYDRTVILFAKQILRHKRDETRTSVIIHLFLVVQQLYLKNHDIHSVRIILSTFDHPSIFRLREAWRLFRVQKPKFYRALKYLWNVLSQENNWNEYYLWLEQKFIRDCLKNHQPMLPFVGYILSKMIIDHFDYYRIYKRKNNEKSTQINTTLMEYVKSSLKRH